MNTLFRKSAALLLSLTLVWGNLSAASAADFTDTQGHPAQTAISRWTEYGIVSGYGEEFRPDQTITRGQMAKILSNTLGLTQASENTFSDVKDTDWFAPFVLRCARAGIMKGNNGQAQPGKTINRQEAMVMIARALGLPAGDPAVLKGFADVDALGMWAAPAVAALVSMGAVSGTRLSPREGMTRADFLAILDKAVTLYINAPGTYSLPEAGLTVAASGDVTLKGDTKGNVLITAAAAGKPFRFQDASVSGLLYRAAGVEPEQHGSCRLPAPFLPGEEPHSAFTMEDGNVVLDMLPHGYGTYMLGEIQADNTMNPVGAAWLPADKPTTFFWTSMARAQRTEGVRYGLFGIRPGASLNAGNLVEDLTDYVVVTIAGEPVQYTMSKSGDKVILRRTNHLNDAVWAIASSQNESGSGSQSSSAEDRELDVITDPGSNVMDYRVITEMSLKDGKVFITTTPPSPQTLTME